MELGLYALTALVSLGGGMIILARSGVRSGRVIAVGLLFLALMEVCYFLSLLVEDVTPLRFASLFQLCAISSLIASVISMEHRISRNKTLLTWVHWGMALICVAYAIPVMAWPRSILFQGDQGFPVLGPVGSTQSALILVGSIIFIWIVENMLRSSSDTQKRVLKYPALGSIAVGVSLLLSAIYRLSSSAVADDIMILSSLIMLVGISFLIFFSIRFKLFEMDIFVSRYVVYHSITFLSIGAYLLAAGIILLGIQKLGLEPSFVTTGFLAFLALLGLSFLIISPEMRSRLRFFINTHFFSNKYDYRKEWGELSRYLSISFNENQIIHVTSQVILESMYIQELSLWLVEGPVCRCVHSFPHPRRVETIVAEDPFLAYLEDSGYFLRKTPPEPGDPEWEEITTRSKDLISATGIELAVAMMAENRLIGFIAVGKENPGTPYGRDDIDLLSAIASQTSAALMSARFAKKLAENKEIDAYNRVSAYVLHDLKNAAGNLSLILQNAPRFISQKEFQEDMLGTIAEALARIDKVTGKLATIPGKEELTTQVIPVAEFLDSLLGRLQPRLNTIRCARQVEETLQVTTDPAVLDKIMENLVVNATEALPSDGEITISAGENEAEIFISVADNGPGMPEEFVRERLFRPFQTTKKKGSGLGLWQVKNLTEQIGARIEVENRPGRGATFTIVLPSRPGHDLSIPASDQDRGEG
ncbi:MAG: XrtA/PEP-CTERM system histidine kinase PrsK [Desulfomonilia bacterium]